MPDSKDEPPSKPPSKFKLWREEQERKRVERLNKKQPWLARKAAAFLAVGIMAYATYCFLARICVPMVKQTTRARGSRTQGICFIVFFSILFCFMAWSYAVLLSTGPGFVKDFVEQTPSPEPPNQDEMEQASNIPGGPSFSSMNIADANRDEEAAESNNILGAINPKVATAAASMGHEPTAHPSAPSTYNSSQANGSSSALDQAKPSDAAPWDLPQRRPSPVPVLLPYYRWCTRCEVIKPYRAHHCRHCGTCVLKMDHHCPWVGSCVGARNYRYFLLFLFWCAIWIDFIFLATLLSIVPPTRPPNTSTSIDPQHIVLISIAGFFGMFVNGMLGSHIIYVCHNQTTIEDIGSGRIKDDEAHTLGKAHGQFNLLAHRKTKKRWNQEWGRLRKEGNPWWLGSWRKNFKMVFGRQKLGWFVPIRIKDGDEGLVYEVNPRHTPGGIWQPRWLWPKELR